MVCTRDARLTPLGCLANQGVTTIQRISDTRNSPLVMQEKSLPYGGPGGRATRRCLCDDGDATIGDDDATIDDDDATIDDGVDDGEATIDDDDAMIDDGDAIIYQLSNTVITHARAPDRTPRPHKFHVATCD